MVELRNYCNGLMLNNGFGDHAKLAFKSSRLHINARHINYKSLFIDFRLLIPFSLFKINAAYLNRNHG